MIDGGHLHHRAGPGLGRVVAGELAERPFRQRDLAHRQQMALEHDLGMRRDRQAGLRPGDDLDRRAFDGAGELVFRLPGRQIFEAGDEQRRVLAVDHRDRTGLALVPVFPGDDGAVPAAVVELHGHPVPAVHLDAIDRGVDPAAVRIAHDDDRARADEGAAVVAVPDRRREACARSTSAPVMVFSRKAASRTGHGLVRLQRLALLHPGLERVERPQRRIEAERQRRPLRIGHRVGEDAEAARKALDVVEQQRRAVRHAGRDLGDAADLEPRIGARRSAAARCSLSTSAMNSRKSLYIRVGPKISGRHRPSRPYSTGSRPRPSLWPMAILAIASRISFANQEGKHHGQASPHRAHRSRSGEGRQVLRGGLRHEGRGPRPARGLRVRRHHQRRAAQAGGRTRRSASTTSACGSTISTRPRRRWWTPAAPISTAGRRPTAPGAPANAHSYYEAKYKDPLGIVFDLTHTGWIGAVKDVVAKN